MRRLLLTALLALPAALPAQQMVTETRDPKQRQDDDFAKAYEKWTTEPRFGSPLVDHLPKVAGIPSPKDVLGYYIGAPRTLTYYADLLRYYKALAAATTVQIENEDLVLRFPISWGIGFALNKAIPMYGPNPKAFGHHGWGGSFGFADPETGLGVGYAMNFMREPQGGVDPRFAGLLAAIYASL